MKKSIVELAKERDQYAQDFYSYSRNLSLDDIQFVMGDSDNMYQWPQAVIDSGINQDKVKLTVNITAQHCNAVTNNIRMNRPQVKVLPVDDYADKETAEIMAGWIRSVQSYSNADDAHDNAMEYSVWGGEGYWEVDLDFESEDSFNEIPYIKPIDDFCTVYIDPFAQNPDKSDAEWGMIKRIMPNAAFDEQFPKANRESWPIDGRWVMKDSVVVCKYTYCEHKPDVLEQYEDGTTGYKSDNKDTEVQAPDGSIVIQPSKAVKIDRNGKQVARKTTRKAWKQCLLAGGEDKPLESRDWPGSYLPIVGVFGKQYTVDGVWTVKGMVRDLKDPARMVNYSYSAAIETVALQTKVPFIASAESIAGYENYWGNANTVNHSVLPYNELSKDGMKPLTQPRRAEAAVIPSAQIQLLQLSVEQMREASGQHQSVFGQSGNETSGVAIQRRKQQGEVATFHFPDNLSRALRYEAQILVDLMPKIMTERQIIRMLGLDGKEEKAVLNPNMTDETGKPIAHAEPNKEGKKAGIKGIFNPNAGKYDVAIVTGPSYATQRQETAEVLTQLAAKDPRFMQIAGDIYFKSLDTPLSEALAERYEKTLPTELQAEEEGEEIPPQIKAQMDELAGKMQEAEQALTEAFDHVKQLEEETAQAKKEKDLAQIEAKQANSLLTINKAEQGLAAKMPQEETINPDIEEILFRLNDNEEKQNAVLDGIYQILLSKEGTQ